METKNYSTPSEIAHVTIQMGIKKVDTKYSNQFILGILAGTYIAFAAAGSNMAAFNLFAKPETYGLEKVLAGSIFETGLMLIMNIFRR